MPADPVQPSRADLFDNDEHSGHAEAPRGRGRRPAPDWGGDDLFDHVPRRRFARGTTADDRRRPGTPHAGRHHAAAPARPERRAPDQPVPAPVQELRAARRAEYEVAPPVGRRTVTITGRPGHRLDVPRTAGHARRRGPRTVEERIGARPDRIAAWAVALGMLSSAVALLT